MQRRPTYRVALTWLLFLGPAWVGASDTPLSGNCGYMCHVPMIGESGHSLMAWQGLRPLEGDLAQMKTRFGIRPAQESAWQKFAAAVNKPLPNWHKSFQAKPPSTSMERAKTMELIWHDRYEHMATVTKTFQALYEILDDQQKRVADQRFGYCELTR